MSNAIAFASYVETAYDCSGVCSAGLFPFARPLIDGIPSETCLESIQESMQDAKPIWIVVILTAVFSLTLWVFQYVLWFRFKE